MPTHLWNPQREPAAELAELVAATQATGVLVIRFEAAPAGPALPWQLLEPWTRTRAVTVADVTGRLTSPALEVALLADLVVLREDAEVVLGDGAEPVSAGLVRALGRAGRPALARGLLEGGVLDARECMALDLAAAVVAADAALPLPTVGVAALTATRDLLRAGASGRGAQALELASFRLLFATGEPAEGARAFLERRPPRFGPPPAEE